MNKITYIYVITTINKRNKDYIVIMLQDIFIRKDDGEIIAFFINN